MALAEPAVSSTSPGIRYVGQWTRAVATHHTIGAGLTKQLPLRLGDQVTLTNLDGGCTAWLLTLDAMHQPSPALFGFNEKSWIPLPGEEFDAAALRDWAKQHRIDFNDLHAFALGAADAPAGEQHQFRAGANGSLWCIVPTSVKAIEHGGGGRISVSVARPAADEAPALPAPFGPVREEFLVARCTARAYKVKAGETIQIIDVHGQQCSDFMALREDALCRGVERSIDATVTRTLVGGAYPGPGLMDKYFDQDMRPMLAVVQDTVGRHDTFALACTARGYEDRGFPGHANCSDNISQALAPFGVAPRVAWPAINLFFNSWILPSDNRLRADEAWSRPGDYVVLRALTDLVCVSTACPDDVDPINGWNPTDIHVRIYPADQPIATALAYRPDAASEPTLTQNSAFHPRTSALTRLFAPARDVWLPVSYEATRTLEEYRACREAVTVQDLSSLRKYDVVGPDAERLLDHCLTRDMRRLSINRGSYALACDESGAVIDDGTVWRLASDVFRWLPSSEHSAQCMQEWATRRGWKVWVRSHQHTLANLAIQGPQSRELLRKIVFTQPTQTALDQVKWFGFTIARLRDREGPVFMLTRSGYTGELGYEIFCNPAHALQLWDAVMEAGADLGVSPMGSEALGLLRVEAGLAAQGAEFGGDVDAFEAGLGFAIDFSKPDFVGKAALEQIKTAPRRVLTGLLLAGNEVPAHGDGVFASRQRVGVVTSAARSPALGCAIALARVGAQWAAPGQALEIGRLDGQMKRLPCKTAPFPFVDPQRVRARS